MIRRMLTQYGPILEAQWRRLKLRLQLLSADWQVTAKHNGALWAPGDLLTISDLRLSHPRWAPEGLSAQQLDFMELTLEAAWLPFSIRYPKAQETTESLTLITAATGGVQQYTLSYRIKSQNRLLNSGIARRAIDVDTRGINIFQHRDEISAQAFHKHLSHKGYSRPLMLICETINICNLKCRICAYTEMERIKDVMPMDIFQQVVRDYCDIGGGAFSLTPVVGDALLDKHLAERLTLLRQTPEITRISVTTNAVAAARMPQEKLTAILNQLDILTPSIYGLDADEFLQMTRMNTYDRMVEGIRAIFANKPDNLHIRFGLRLLKQRSQAEIVRWFEETLGVKEAEYGVTWEYYNWGIFDTSKALPFDASWVEKPSPNTQCLIPTVAMQVFSNGDVSFCHCDDFDATPELHLGNIRQQSLREMYNSPKAQQLMNFEQHTPEFCKRCSFHQPLSNIKTLPWVWEEPTHFIGG